MLLTLGERELASSCLWILGVLHRMNWPVIMALQGPVLGMCRSGCHQTT